MEEVYHIKNISQMNDLLGQDKAKHPLISIVDFSKIPHEASEYTKISTDLYSIMLKSHCPGALRYGRQYYDFQEGTLIFIGPGQVLSVEKDEEVNKDVEGWGIFFHPDLIRGTSLSTKMKEYSFFSYDVHEALHLSEVEKKSLTDVVKQIEHELSLNIDKHSQTLIVSNLELLLNYCTRYYDRQFITRTNSNKDILSKFEKVLSDYIGSDLIREKGLPSVKYCAEKLNFSANYLSDLLKKETGKNAQEHIHYQIIEEAKNRLLISTASVSEIAYDLGFEYPQYFSKMFKKKTGMTPAKYRVMN